MRSISRSDRPFADVWNAVGVLGMSLVLLIAFYYQIAHHELPCPLCLLQRAGFVVMGLGFLFNVKLGERGAHYAMVLTGALLTGFISMRQVALHLALGDSGYGSTLFGLQFYTWAVIAALLTIVYVAFIFVVNDAKRGAFIASSMRLRNIAFAVFTLLVAANLISTVLECGGGQCEDNPLHYLLLE
jgi:disulfide bond formation protein DsbB